MKPLHKWIGIIISIIVIWMSLSGIFLNHPEIIEDYSVGQYFIPEHYNLRDWNRSTLIGSLVLENDTYFYGRQGIFITKDEGDTFSEISLSGYPKASRLKRTNHLSAYANASDTVLLASTNGGLYRKNLHLNKWSKIELPTSNPVLKSISRSDGIYIFTNSEAFRFLPKTNQILPVDLKRNSISKTMPMVDFFFQLHDGKAWGMPGKLFFDFAGIILIFLSVSGLYIWLKPKSLRRKKGKQSTKILKWNYKNHLKYGFYFSFPILIIAATGIFMRPPLIILLTGEIPLKYFPGIVSENKWEHKIRNVFWDSTRDIFVIDAKDGYFTGNINTGFNQSMPPISIFPMGATVFEEEKGKYIIGSFLGLFECDIETGRVKDLVFQASANIENPFMPGKNMVTGMAKLPDGSRIIATYDTGVINSDKYKMPEFIAENYRMPLWNYMFELHNGRLFKSMIGGYYILLVPLSGILLLIVSITGLIRYFTRKNRKIAKKEK